MTRTLLLLVALYLVWRIATILGRRRARQYRADLGRKGWTYGGPGVAARCDLCGSYLGPGEVRWEGQWPTRRAVCANGCPVDVDGELVE